MLTFARRPKPGMRRVLDAIRSIASDAEERPNKGAVDPRMESFLIRGNRKVPHLYREVLATQGHAASRAGFDPGSPGSRPNSPGWKRRTRAPGLQFPLPKCRMKGRP